MEPARAATEGRDSRFDELHEEAKPLIEAGKEKAKEAGDWLERNAKDVGAEARRRFNRLWQ